MSWSSIKKAINSRLEKPLNEQMDTHASTLLTNITTNRTQITNLNTNMNTKFNAPRVIKKVQRGAVSLSYLSGGRNSGTATISSVDTAKSFVIVSGNGGVNTYNSGAFQVGVTSINLSSTSLTLQSVPSQPVGSCTVAFQVVEFY